MSNHKVSFEVVSVRDELECGVVSLAFAEALERADAELVYMYDSREISAFVAAPFGFVWAATADETVGVPVRDGRPQFDDLLWIVSCGVRRVSLS